MVDLFSWYFHVNSCILRGLFIESSLMVNLLPCASLTVSQKLAFSSSFRTTTTYFGLFVKNLSVQVTSTLTIFVEHDPSNIINGSANQTSRIAIFGDLAFNIYGNCHSGCHTHNDCIAFSS